jgi:hypothetical protein
VPQVKAERSGWRDQALSSRHRRWGWDAPFVDFDGIEYDDGKPLFMVEYKEVSAPPVSPKASNIRALCEVADRARLPFFVIRYQAEPEWSFLIRPANRVAKALKDVPLGKISEQEYVQFRYRFAGRECPAEVLQGLGAKRPAPRPFLTPEQIGKVDEEALRDIGRTAFGINYDGEELERF